MTTPGPHEGGRNRAGHGAAAPRPSGLSDRPVPFRPPVFLPWALAAGFAALTIWLGQALLTTRKQAESQQTESRLSELALRESRNRMEAERIVLERRLADATRQTPESGGLGGLQIATLLPDSDTSPQPLAVAVWDPVRQEGVLSVEKLPALSSDQDYQLWLTDSSGQNPAKGGVFTPDAHGAARVTFKSARTLSAITAFAITRERKGGARKPDGPAMLHSR